MMHDVDYADSQKEYILQLKVKNGPLTRAMRRAGFASVKALSVAAGVSYVAAMAYFNLKRPPMRRNGEWSPTVLALSNVLKIPPEMLFPEQHYRKALAVNSAEIEASSDDVVAIMEWGIGGIDDKTPEQKLISDQVNRTVSGLLNTLNPREERVIRLRFGFDGPEQTIEQVGCQFGVTRERIRQIECKAIRKMKHPKHGLRRSMIEAAA